MNRCAYCGHRCLRATCQYCSHLPKIERAMRGDSHLRADLIAALTREAVQATKGTGA